MEGFVYVLGCATESRYLTYVGWTTDLARRLAPVSYTHLTLPTSDLV